MQNLSKPFDLVVSKLAWGIEWTFIKALRNLKICTFMGSFCPKRNWRENWLVAWKMTRNLVNFNASSWLKIWTWWVLLLKAYKVLDEKVYTEELSLMRVESDTKFEEKLALGFKNDMTNLVNFNASIGKSENLHFDVLLLSIAYIKFQLKKCRRVISHDTEEWSKLWRKTHFLFEKWHKKFDVF